ncbi:MAG TPA: nucleoside triphosphate pyrophosphohydrolase [Ilumatobacteraceae bacterium]|nr:nucleoside triphosphate pyrophosphohydrolase [Ilumatobacteraceae bacterium]HQY15938.1 nucleoside triphosphate pyrophosphohydrolase [Ilumatobacteraceae bacterium]HQY86389.1 nucleoside triphosphate pyrophosphohydrolase [Ilumatobacteraceae bacterium]HRA84951.1 nucleoside triphosphate pyrophosphohydrolase [Ilumatobacteraceae bacterium]
MTTPRIVIVGLGPAGPEYVTEHTRAEIARVAHRYLRTDRHPSASLVPDADTFDDVYEAADTFADVYAEIADRLAAAAQLHGEVLYAVPGSPLILERTVRALRTDQRIECTIHPAMSFLDIAYARLGIDPVEANVTLVDGHEFAIAAAGMAGPLLVAHTHANWVLSDIKLAVENATGDEPVVILQRLGSPDERITHTTWAELDRTVEADHLTSIYIPHLAAPVGSELVRFHQLARTLREQCPWDQEQTHQSLVRYLLEETYEVVDALHALDPEDPTTDDALIEELGDLLYQIEFHATIAEQEGRFTMADVAQGVHDKLVRRHPHVFGDVVADDTHTVLANWDLIKQQEKGRTSVFEGVPHSLPSLSYADAVQRKAAKVGFDWPDVDGAWPKIEEEAAEVRAAVHAADTAAVRDELGDLLFAVVNVARHLGVEPEAALRAATLKFRRRFEQVEVLARERGLVLQTAGLEALDTLWAEVKTGE